jgi:hypothetical protein
VSTVCYNAWRRRTSTLKLDEYISPVVAVATLSAGIVCLATFFAIFAALYVYVKNRREGVVQQQQPEFKSIARDSAQSIVVL